MSLSSRSAGLVAAGLLLALTACGGGDEPTGPDAAADLDAVRNGDVPTECVAAFPLAVEPADIADVAHRPATLPAPPVEGTLCQTSSTLDDSLSTADYVTEATPTEVLDAYEQQLGATYEVVRDDNGAGETLTGELGDGVFFQVTPGDGRYSIAFGTE